MVGKIQTWIFSLFIFLNIQQLPGQNIDIDLLRDINIHRNTKLDPAFKVLSQSMIPVSFGVPVITTGIGLIRKDKKLIDNGLQSGAALVISTVFTYGLKYSINRSRPYDTYLDIQNLSKENDPSFPSGHASSSFAIATSLSLQYKKWYIITPAYLWAGGVSYSRMHMGVHYPSDVLAGALIGAGSAYLCYKGQQWLNKKYNHKRNLNTIK